VRRREAGRVTQRSHDRHGGHIDWWGNITFAVGLSAARIAVTYGIQPYAGHAMAPTTSPTNTLPPVSSLFAAVLGEHPVKHLLAPSGVLHTLTDQAGETLTAPARDR
jgi:hypothetical protein